jgi:hypothetical protein
MVRDFQNVRAQIAFGQNQPRFGVFFYVSRQKKTAIAECDSQDQRFVVVRHRLAISVGEWGENLDANAVNVK